MAWPPPAVLSVEHRASTDVKQLWLQGLHLVAGALVILLQGVAPVTTQGGVGGSSARDTVQTLPSSARGSLPFLHC